jgi:8-amino-7-oxononanoate synthase
MSLEEFAAAKLTALTEKSLRRDLVETTRTPGAIVHRNGKRLISFSCNDYLNLSTHPAIIEAAVAATRLYGAGAGASRAVTGNHPLYAALESRLAALKGTESCLVFGSGYLANSGIIPALMGKDDLIFADELSHACIWAGAKLAHSTVVTFPHNDMAHLAALLTSRRAAGANALIVTDAVFSMDGDLAPIATLAGLAQKHDCWLLTDDAHGLGVIPRNAAVSRVDLQMGTLSKAVGAYGGYVCASEQVVALIRNRARSYIYTTGLPPGTIAAAIAALDFIAANRDYAALPLAKAKRFTRALGLPDAVSPIVPLIIGGAEAALAASERLANKGFLAAAIRPPTVPPGTARLRLAFCAAHEDHMIDDLAACIRREILVPA